MAFGDIVLLQGGKPRGPFTRAQIRQALGRGECGARDLAHTPGLRDWRPLLEVLHHLDRETMSGPRPREAHPLPPLPGASADSGPIAAPPVTGLPPLPVPDPLPADVLPPPFARNAAAEKMSGPKEAVRPPGLPLPELATTTAASNRTKKPPALSGAASRPPFGEAAPFGMRAFAFAIDCAVLFLPVLAVFGFAYFVGSIRGSLEHRDPETARQEQALLWRQLRDLVLLVANGFAWIYAAGLESSRWQGTIGKQAMGLVVTDEAGARPGFLRATGRHAAKYLSALPLFLGFMAALVGPRRLAWHDRLAGTRVAKRTNLPQR